MPVWHFSVCTISGPKNFGSVALHFFEYTHPPNIPIVDLKNLSSVVRQEGGVYGVKLSQKNVVHLPTIRQHSFVYLSFLFVNN